MAELWQLPATELAMLIRSGQVSAREAVQAALDHYARPVLVKPFELSELEGTVKAWRSP